MLEQRKSLVEERKRAAAKTKLQKESIAKVMDEVRTNASMANKIITQALTGKITLESLTSPGKLKSGGRSKSANNINTKRRFSKNGNDHRGSSSGGTGDYGNTAVSADRMGLGRESNSAGIDAEFENKMENPENRKVYSLPSLPPQNAPQPYKSPYNHDNSHGTQ